MSYKKTLIINFYILITILFLPSIIFSSFKLSNKIYLKSLHLLKNNKFKKNIDNYSLVTSLTKNLLIFKEFSNLESDFLPYIGWRRKNINKKFITITGKYNTRLSTGEKLNSSVWFFGGSTIWGTGASDNETIPSIYNQVSGENVFNFGESAWQTRQSTNQLMNILGDGYRPSKIVFYSGYNNVYFSCRSDIKNSPNYAYQNRIISLLSEDRKHKNIISTGAVKLKNWIISPYYYLSRKISLKNIKNQPELFDCHSNSKKANLIANHLVNDWYNTFLIAKSINSKFYAILQPNYYSSDGSNDYLEENKLIKKQFEILNPLILKTLNKKCLEDKSFCSSFIDGTKWISRDENVFIDDCHLNSRGNRVVVESFIDEINQVKSFGSTGSQVGILSPR